jgi:hypothetical protein
MKLKRKKEEKIVSHNFFSVQPARLISLESALLNNNNNVVVAVAVIYHRNEKENF